MKLKFSAKIRYVGNSWIVTIPKDYVSNGLIDPEKELLFYLEEQD